MMLFEAALPSSLPGSPSKLQLRGAESDNTSELFANMEPCNVEQLVLFHHPLGDEGLRSSFLIRRVQQFSSLRLVDLSFCQLTTSSQPILLGMICALSQLEFLFLDGNFRTSIANSPALLTDASSRYADCVGAFCDTWRDHPSLVVLRLDPWLTRGHSDYWVLSRQRQSQNKQRAFRNKAGGDSSLQNTGLHRAHTVFGFMQQEVPDELLLATKKSQQRNLASQQPATSVVVNVKEVELRESETRTILELKEGDGWKQVLRRIEMWKQR